MKIRLCVFLCILSLTASIPAFAASGSNLLSNPGFEESESEILNWNQIAFDGNASDYTLEKGKAHGGKYFVTINNRNPNDARLTQTVTVKYMGKYKITGWIKTENVGEDAIGANLSFNDRWFLSKEIKGTSDWEQIEFYLSVEDDQVSSLDLCMRLGGYGAVNTGKASFDDILMEEVADIPADASAFVIENQQGSPNNTIVQNTGTTEQNETQKPPVSISVETGQLILVVIILLCAVGVFIFFLISYKPKNGEKPVNEPDKP